MVNAIGYIRTSADEEAVAQYKWQIMEIAEKEGLRLDTIICETNGAQKYEREIYTIVEELTCESFIIFPALAHIGYGISQVYDLVQRIINKGATIIILSPSMRISKENRLSTDSLLAALAAAKQLEHELMGERIKKVMATRKEGEPKVGRPKGKGIKVKEVLASKGITEETIREYYTNSIMSISAIARLLGLDRRTITSWLRKEGLYG